MDRGNGKAIEIDRVELTEINSGATKGLIIEMNSHVGFIG